MTSLKSVFLYFILILSFVITSCSSNKKPQIDMASFGCTSPPAEYSSEVDAIADAELKNLANISNAEFSSSLQNNNSKLLSFFQARVDVDIFLYKVCMNKTFTKEQSNNATERVLYLWEKAIQINPQLLNPDPV